MFFSSIARQLNDSKGIYVAFFVYILNFQFEHNKTLCANQTKFSRQCFQDFNGKHTSISSRFGLSVSNRIKVKYVAFNLLQLEKIAYCNSKQISYMSLIF